MQGGGAYIEGSAEFTGCYIFNNEASSSVRSLTFWTFLPAPRWNVT